LLGRHGTAKDRAGSLCTVRLPRGATVDAVGITSLLLYDMETLWDYLHDEGGAEKGLGEEVLWVSAGFRI
jgi:hypothetical protein